MIRVLLGLLKGGLLGVGLGFLAFKVGISSGVTAFLAYGLLGGVVGIVGGKAPWRQETLWTPVLKGVVGFLVGMGLFWVAGKALGNSRLPFAHDLGAPDEALVRIPFLLAPLIGIVYGIFVEVDDGSGGKDKKAAGPGGGK